MIKRTSARRLLLICLLYSCLPAIKAANLQVESGTRQVGLLELYTSEGCSSCPPADRWVSSLLEKPGLWNTFIPVALHVDYWDYIGWKDRFAIPSYGNRQRNYARENSLKTVYTPGFIYNGKEWRNWFKKRRRDFPAAEETGVLKLDVQDRQVRVDFDPLDRAQRPSRVHVALLGFDIKTRVKAGENDGRTLTHNFVVLGLDTARMEGNGSGFNASMTLPEARVPSERYAVVAWVSSSRAQAPIQSVGGWLQD